MELIGRRGLQVLLCAMLFLPVRLHAQTVDEVRNSGRYYFGIGTGDNYNAARRDALESLTGSISVHVSSEFEQVVRETGSSFESHVKSAISTYSSAVVNRYEERVLSEGKNGTEVMVFITRKEMEAIFEQRTHLINDFIRSAMRAEDDLRIADALRYFYWALILARSHPDNTKLRFAFGGDTDEPVMMGLYDRINRIFSFLDITPEAIQTADGGREKEITLAVRYRGKPAQDLDYTYWVGDGYSAPKSARNGRGTATLRGEAARNFDQLRLRTEYQYHNKARLEPEVQLMLENTDLPFFERAELRIDITEAGGEIGSGKTVAEAAEERKRSAPDAETAMLETLTAVTDAVAEGNPAAVRDRFTEKGYSLFSQMMSDAEVRVLPMKEGGIEFWERRNGYSARPFPMTFAYRNNRAEFVEDVVFNFNAEGLIENTAFSIGDVAIEGIMSRPEAFGTPEDRYVLISFMEDYKTAYSLKRHDFLNAVFDDGALIIVGNVVQRSTTPADRPAGMYGNLSMQEVEYIQLSKSEYMNRLGRIFARNEFINIRFEDNQVRKTQKDEKIYGIQIAQHYYSATYADKGYLFLMIDLNDSLNPKIYVRTWQPEKNPDGTVFGLEDFRF